MPASMSIRRALATRVLPMKQAKTGLPDFPAMRMTASAVFSISTEAVGVSRTRMAWTMGSSATTSRAWR